LPAFETSCFPEKYSFTKSACQMMNWIMNNKLLIAGIILGAVGGYLYWQEIGCTSGSCAITSKWHNSTAYGAMMGGLLFSMFKREKKADNKK
jgi:hypothetical protein